MMNTKLSIKKSLPERTLGRSGQDLFSSRKDLTVIMVAFERFSPFAKAVDDLYRSIDVPFNLIVVEGNAPESVRDSLEKRQKKHKNLTIIYSNHQVSIGAAVNLAVPHLKTKYAFIVDNDVRIPRGAMSRLLQAATENQYGIVCPQNYVVCSRWANGENKGNVQNLGIRTCLLISKEALEKIKKFDESMTPFTLGIDLRMAAEELGISICHETSTCMGVDCESFLWPMDASLHSFQWNEDRAFSSLRGLERKWGISLQKKDYAAWLKKKKKSLQELQNPVLFFAGILSQMTFQNSQKFQPASNPFWASEAA